MITRDVAGVRSFRADVIRACSCSRQTYAVKTTQSEITRQRTIAIITSSSRRHHYQSFATRWCCCLAREEKEQESYFESKRLFTPLMTSHVHRHQFLSLFQVICTNQPFNQPTHPLRFTGEGSKICEIWRRFSTSIHLRPEDVSVRRTFETLAHYRCYVIALYKSTFTYLLTYYITGWAVALTCYYSHSDRKKADFDPSGSHNPLTNFDQTWHGWLR